jgi:lipopolysaccharide export system ATP-binding protein
MQNEKPQTAEVAMENAGAVKAKVLRSEGLVKQYKSRTVVNEVSIRVQQGEVVGLLGPNGAGKTTTFYMIVGMVKPNAGKVFLDDADISHEPMYKRARMGVGYLSQEASVFRKMTVEENILAVLELMNLPRSERRQRCSQLMEDFGITQVAKSKGYVLSGGERRRTEIARALATDPKFILLDEPFAGIDPIAVEDIMRIVHDLKNRNIGVLVTDHNVHETLSITDRSYLLYEGRILKSGTTEYLANDPEARKLYLGEKFRLDRYE